MKVFCELQGTDGKRVTDTEIELVPFSCYGIFSDNPFPASHFFSGVIGGSLAQITYRVNPARGEA